MEKEEEVEEKRELKMKKNEDGEEKQAQKGEQEEIK